MPSRTVALAKAMKAHIEALSDDVTGGRRLEVSIPDDPSHWAETPKPELMLIPLGESRSRGRLSVVRRPSVDLLFTGPLKPEYSRDDWLTLTEAVVDSLDLASLENFHWFSTEVDSLYDRDMTAVGRFAALYNVAFSSAVVTA